MFISKKRHEQIVEDLKKHYEKKLEQANDLKTILAHIPTTIFGNDSMMFKGNFVAGGYTMPDNVLVYVDDLLGGKVIKQEGTKCIVIESDGSVKTGLTKEAPDKGFNYRLLRK